MSEKHYPYTGGGFNRIVFDGDGSVWVPERLCEVESAHANDYGYAVATNDYTYELSCGHRITWDYCPDYCPWCGAKVVEE